MKILVTGGAGFIGSHVCEELLHSYPTAQVTILDNLSVGQAANVSPQFKLVQMDIRSAEIPAFLVREQFDGIIHLAAQTMVPDSLKNPRFDAEENVMGLVNVLEAAKDSGVKSMVFSSSAAIYGDNTSLPLLESEVPCPTSFYGLTKTTAEEYFRLYQKLYNMNMTVLRFANVYGERQGMSGEGGVISIFAKKLVQGEAIQVFGDGQQTRDFVYVKDIAKALCLALSHHGLGLFNVSTGQEVSLNKLITTFAQTLGVEPKVEYLPPRAGDIYRSVLSNQAIGAELGLTEFTPLEKGLAQTCAYFKEIYNKTI